MKIKIHVFKAKDGWRWHMKRSGRIIAESGEGYVHRAGCKRSLTNLLVSVENGQFLLVED